MKPNTTRQTGSTSKSVHPRSFPIFRVDSVTAANVPVAAKEASEVKCTACKCLVHDLNLQRRRTLAESPSRKIKRQDSSSHVRLDKMSPFSQQKCKQRTQYERSSSKQKLNKLEESEVLLDDEQSEEMCAVMDVVQDDELELLHQEGDQHGVGGLFFCTIYPF